ncbi:MAG: hypothetical protein U1E36_04670 [Rickettsiales bacterium]
MSALIALVGLCSTEWIYQAGKPANIQYIATMPALASPAVLQAVTINIEQ